MKKISICMGYINRKIQLMNTLQSIHNQEIDPNLFDIIIVDDVSRDEHRLHLEDFYKFNLDIKLISISTFRKWWVNPVIALNTALNFVDAERVILQNPECLHASNILDYVLNNLDDCYTAFSTKALTKVSTENIDIKNLKDIDESGFEWYCHSEHRNHPLNFCASVKFDDLKKIGSFDNSYAKGFWYDDNALIQALHNNNIKTKIEDNQLVYHQWHENNWDVDTKFQLIDKNKTLFINERNK